MRYYHWHYHHLMSYYVVLIHNTTATRSTGGAKGALAWMRHCGCLQTILRTELTELCACVGAQHCDSHAHGSHPQGTALRAAAEALSGSAPHQNPVVCRARGGSCAVAKASVAWWARVSRRPRAACSRARVACSHGQGHAPQPRSLLQRTEALTGAQICPCDPHPRKQASAVKPRDA